MQIREHEILAYLEGIETMPELHEALHESVILAYLEGIETLQQASEGSI